MYQLMERAGLAAFELMQQQWPHASKILVLVGAGNNGGDGYVLARLARQQGLSVTLCCADPSKATVGDAEQAKSAYIKSGGKIDDWQSVDFNAFDLLVDALLGTGLSGGVRSPYSDIIAQINSADTPVLSIDIPSGADADTGATLLSAVQAQHTITFVGVKMGLTTANGKQLCGSLHFADLGIGAAFENLVVAAGQLTSFERLPPFPQRPKNSHKGHFGRLLCIGGNQGMPGAIRLAAEAAMRCGAGLVKVYCHPHSQLAVGATRAELMVSVEDLALQLQWASCIMLGPGLGQDSWSERVFSEVIQHLEAQPKPVLIDADGLNLLAKLSSKPQLSQLVLTPHPGEAGRLLDINSADVEQNRFSAAKNLAREYNATTVLKGAGSIIENATHCWICQDGNPGMATGGMGDVLSGVISALLAQGMAADIAALYGTCIHAKAADLAAQSGGERGMLASDLFVYLRQLVNS